MKGEEEKESLEYRGAPRYLLLPFVVKATDFD
jgi:hypothetical protein